MSRVRNRLRRTRANWVRLAGDAPVSRFVSSFQTGLSRWLNLTQGREADPLDRSIDLHVSRLRQKLGDDARAPKLLKTLRNEGYLLAATVTRG